MTREEKINTLKAIIQECEEYQWQRKETLLEIIKSLEQEPTTKNDLGVDCISRQAVLDEMEKRHAEGDCITKGFIKNMPSVIPQDPRWIPVSEKLPNWDIQCLVTDGDGEYGVGYYRKDVHAWDSPNWGWLERKDRVDNKEAFTEPCGIRKVVAWMPLPNSFREVK